MNEERHNFENYFLKYYEIKFFFKKNKNNLTMFSNLTNFNFCIKVRGKESGRRWGKRMREEFCMLPLPTPLLVMFTKPFTSTLIMIFIDTMIKC